MKLEVERNSLGVLDIQKRMDECEKKQREMDLAMKVMQDNIVAGKTPGGNSPSTTAASMGGRAGQQRQQGTSVVHLLRRQWSGCENR